jgi:hypothetical protein
VKLRTMTAAMTLALAVTGLSACTSKVGVAAVVDGHNITEATVASYVSPGTPAKATASTVAPPKVQVLSTLIQDKLFAATISRTKGGLPDAAGLAKYHDVAVQNVLQLSQTGAAADKTILNQITQLGYRAKFVHELIRSVELNYLLVIRLQAKTQGDITTAVTKANKPVVVSGRYGKWDLNQFSVVSTGSSGRPSFFKLATTAK